MKPSIVGMLVVLLAAGPASAQDQPAKPKKPRPECRSEAMPGSHMAKSTCHSKEEWAVIDDENRRQAARFINTVVGNAARTDRGITDVASQMGIPR